MKNLHASTRFLTAGAMIAALYVLLTWLSALCGLSSGVIQCRLSEALCVLPLFTPAAVPGLFVGCLLANLLTGAVFYDVLFGSLATLIGAAVTYLCRKAPFWLAPLPTIIANAAVIPFVLQFCYGAEESYWFLLLTVTAGEVISAGILGSCFAWVLRRRKNIWK